MDNALKGNEVMPLIPLTIPPGVFKNGTDLQASGRWADADLVRWHDDSLKPIGGWRNRLGRGWSHPIRGLIGWKSNSGSRYLACGTYSSLFAILPNNSTYDITPTGFTAGRISASGMTGFGSGFYSNSTYGTPPINTSTTLLDATAWSLSAWGENLIANSPDDGKVYEWALNTGSASAVLSNAPTGVVTIIVSDERFLFALKPREVHWSDQENNNTWTASATNQAGDIKLETQGSIKCAEKIRGGILIITDQDAHTCTYIGQPYVHSIQRVGDGCGIFSNQASTTINQGVVWMGDAGFHIYSGGRVQELKCDVTDHIFTEMSMSQKSKVACVANSKFDEVIWYYPSASGENEKYVSWNYKNNSWSIGTLGRTCGIDAGVFNQPIHATTQNHDNNYSRGRFTILTTYLGQTPPGSYDGTNATDKDDDCPDVDSYVIQLHDISGMTGTFTFSAGTPVNRLDSSHANTSFTSLGYLVTNTTGTTYESVVFSAQKLKCYVASLHNLGSGLLYTVAFTGLDENGVAQTESMEVYGNGTASDASGTYRNTTKTWTKLTGLVITKNASSSVSTADFGVALQSYGTTTAKGQISTNYTPADIDIGTNNFASKFKVIDVEVTEGTFIEGGYVKYVTSSSGNNHDYGINFSTQLLTHNKDLLTPLEYMLVEHEVGEERDSLVPFAESGAIQIGNGDQVMHVNQVIPDEKTQGQVNVDFKTRFYPNGDETTHGTYALANPTSVRFQGREVRMKIKNVSGDWRVGNFRLNAMAGGKR